ncbi:MAG: ATP phosphoribosyltransferase regulatory subunit [bacterium]
MRNLFATLSALGYRNRIRIDMAELGGARYYTGIAFNIVSEVAGRSLGRGGRATMSFWPLAQKQPAVGFSLTTGIVDALQPGEIDVPTSRSHSDAVVVGDSLVQRFSGGHQSTA